MRSSRDYRIEAKALVQPQKNKLALLYFLYDVLVGVVSSLGVKVDFDSLSSTDFASQSSALEGGYGATIVALVAGPFALSFVIAIVKAFKKENVSVKDLFSGFKLFLPALVIDILVGLFCSLWSLLFIIPGIIAAFAYAQAYYVLNDHPEYRANECIKKSKQLMKGHKWELFVLNFSYIGHYILVLLTLGIYSFWLSPKVQMANYLFYLDLKKENGEVVEEEF